MCRLFVKVYRYRLRNYHEQINSVFLFYRYAILWINQADRFLYYDIVEPFGDYFFFISDSF